MNNNFGKVIYSLVNQYKLIIVLKVKGCKIKSPVWRSGYKRYFDGLMKEGTMF